MALIPSKGLRNKIAGFVTHLMKRLDKGLVKGLNIETKRENNSIKKDSNDTLEELDIENKINVDKDTEQMLKFFFKKYF